MLDLNNIESHVTIIKEYEIPLITLGNSSGLTENNNNNNNDDKPKTWLSLQIISPY
jgi:hypothetical protein